MDKRITIRKRPVIKITPRHKPGESTEPRTKNTRRDPTKCCPECGRPRQ